MTTDAAQTLSPQTNPLPSISSPMFGTSSSETLRGPPQDGRLDKPCMLDSTTTLSATRGVEDPTVVASNSKGGLVFDYSQVIDHVKRDIAQSVADEARAEYGDAHVSTSFLLRPHGAPQGLLAGFAVGDASASENSMDPSIAALQSAKTWEELNIPEDLLKGLHAKGFVRPSRIQELSLPLVLHSSQNLVAQAQNGSGKTATFALAMLAKTQRANPNPQSLCLCHTRELATQNMAVICELGKFTGITTWLAVPQCPRYDRAAGAQIIVGTPGKIRETLMKRFIPVQDVSLFVLDEADVLMDTTSNMAAQVNEIRKAFPQRTQVLLFSATYPERVKSFVTSHVPQAKRIEVKKEDLTLSAISQYHIICANDNAKFSVLADLYGSMTVGQSVIFVNSRKIAFELANQMTQEGHAVSLICGTQATGPERMDHATREKVMAEFRNGETKVLIATDVLSRGIDVPQLTLVINYDIPMDHSTHFRSVDYETYIHRIGRTGRFGLKGVAITLVQQHEMPLIQDIQQFYNCQILPLTDDPEQIEAMIHKLRE